MNTAPAATSARYAVRRARRVPPKSANTRIERDPKAANSDVWALPITWWANANTAGMTMAARAALLTATLSPTALDCRRRNLMRSTGNAPRR